MSELSPENQEVLDDLKSQDPDFDFDMLESGDDLFIQDTTRSAGGSGTGSGGFSTGIIEIGTLPPTLDKEPEDDKTPKTPPPPTDDEKKLRIGDKVRVKATGEIGIVVSVDERGVADIQKINE
jgi:hypothetical protein